jgi:hypothetical protein
MLDVLLGIILGLGIIVATCLLMMFCWDGVIYTKTTVTTIRERRCRW